MTVQRVALGLAAATVLAQISYPLTHGSVRDVVTVLVVTLFAAACLAHATAAYGPRWAVGFFVVTAGIGCGAELLGTATGFPFGTYRYADRLGLHIGEVPAVVPLAWTAGIYTVWSVASILVQRKIFRVLAVAVGAVGWDVYLDPQMVADGQWTWLSTHPGLPGLDHIPWTNYLGWFLVALVIGICIELLHGRRNTEVSHTVPVVLYIWTWLGSALAHAVFLDAPELRWSALYGLAAMSILGVPLVRRGVADVSLRTRHG